MRGGSRSGDVAPVEVPRAGSRIDSPVVNGGPGALPVRRRSNVYVVAVVGIIAVAGVMVLASIALNHVARFVYRLIAHSPAPAGYIEGILVFTALAATSGAISWYCRRVVEGEASRGGSAAGTLAIPRMYDHVAAALGLAVFALAIVLLVQDSVASVQAQRIYIEAIVVNGIFAGVGLTVFASHWWLARRPLSTRGSTELRR